jgi:hypothetical protein
VSTAADDRIHQWIQQCVRARDDALAIAQCSIYAGVDSTVRRGRFASKNDEYNNHHHSNFFQLIELTKIMDQVDKN